MAALGIPALLLVYVLSIGPAALLFKHCNVDTSYAARFYTPIFWMHDHTPLKRPLELYVEGWTGHPHP